MSGTRADSCLFGMGILLCSIQENILSVFQFVSMFIHADIQLELSVPSSYNATERENASEKQGEDYG